MTNLRTATRGLTLVGGLAVGMMVTGPATADGPYRSDRGSAPCCYSVNWTGFYLGGQIGYGWGSKKWDDKDDQSDNVTYSTNGFLGGGQLGYNYQIAPWVFGVEADIAWTGMSGSGIPLLEAEPSRIGSRVNWISTVTGRVGYSSDQWLLYGKGGVAWAHDRHSFTETLIPATVSVDKTRAGWTLGAGVEYALANNWSWKLEYDYLKFGRESVTFAPLGDDAVDVDQRIHVVRLGLNYRFGEDRPRPLK